MKLEVPDAVGVPEINPVVLNVSPVDNEPEVIVHVYGVFPPVAASVLL